MLASTLTLRAMLLHHSLINGIKEATRLKHGANLNLAVSLNNSRLSATRLQKQT